MYVINTHTKNCRQKVLFPPSPRHPLNAALYCTVLCTVDNERTRSINYDSIILPSVPFKYFEICTFTVGREGRKPKSSINAVNGIFGLFSRQGKKVTAILKRRSGFTCRMSRPCGRHRCGLSRCS